MMAREGITVTVPPVELLKEEQIMEVHKSTLEVMQKTGIRMEHKKALQLLKREGCQVDEESMMVRFPPELVDLCIEKTPSLYTARAPVSENDLHFGGNTLYFTHTSGMQSIDMDTFEQKVPTKSDYIDAVRVLDSLESIDMLGCYPYFGYEGVMSKMEIPAGVALHLKYCGKHQAAACSNDNEIFTIQMAKTLGHEFSATIGSSPPLTWSEKAIEAAFRIGESKFPLSTVDGAMMGGTGPATPVGSVVLSNAEQLAMIVLIQLLNPGHRVLIGHFSAPLNMKSGSPAFGQIGASISNTIFNQMWRHYRIPFSNGSPGYVNAKTMDYQAGYEKGIAGFISGLSGAHLMLFHFGVSSEVTAHPVQAILDEDIAMMIGRFLKGEEISQETIAAELIQQVGPIPGHYLSRPHTMKWFRKEQCIPKSADTLAYSDWIQKGKKNAIDYARERMEEILAKEEQSYITPSQEADIEKILREAEEYYRKQDE
jgi:trimethylamine---corrinoid protein Co-methyltransferase